MMALADQSTPYTTPYQRSHGSCDPKWQDDPHYRVNHASEVSWQEYDPLSHSAVDETDPFDISLLFRILHLREKQHIWYTRQNHPGASRKPK
jgi:hypothetical protein